MTANVRVATSGSRPELISATFRRLQRMGFENPEAANLAALKNGFGITSRPWTVSELTHLIFLRESRRTGRRWSDTDDRVDRSGGNHTPAVGDRPPARAGGDRGSASVAPIGRRPGADPADGSVTLLTLFRSIAGPNAALDRLRPSARPRPDAAGDVG